MKRLIGRRYDDPMVEKDKKLVPYKIVKASNGDAWVEANGKTYSPSQVSAFILQKMKETAEAHLGREGRAGGHHRSRLFQRRAASGHQGCRQDRRSRSAAHHQRADRGRARLRSRQNEIRHHRGVRPRRRHLRRLHSEIGDGVFEVKSTNGDTFLGGEDFDMRLVGYLADEFQKEQGINLRNDKLALQRLKEAAEKAKIDCPRPRRPKSTCPSSRPTRPGEASDDELTRAKFEALVDDLVQKTIEPCRKALKDAGLTAGEIGEVVLVGGMTRMPKIQEVVKQLFGKEPHKGVNPDEVVASVLRSRPACCRATSRTCCCST